MTLDPHVYTFPEIVLKLILNAGLHKPNCLILDLEEAVAPAKKVEARFMVRNALRSLNFYGAERMVRINQGDAGISDFDFIIPNNVTLILVPKCESAEDLILIENKIADLKKANPVDHDIWPMQIIESASGVLIAY